ncbi:hypothetical protein V3851_10685 [Paenibacillus sp. M1]|uniref:CRISPR-associated protein Csh1 n=1 Tax=Paenibacillus haidiansis TaxID=1574488 RepID=A0ABU7VRF2_9BACL
MLKDLADSYQLAKNRPPEQVIQDSHRPKSGLYLRLRLDQSWAEQQRDFEGNHLMINSKENEEDIPVSNLSLFQWFQVRDYYSSLITMNKAVDGGKQIHSNNPFALFAKREVFLEEKKDSKFSMQDNVVRFLEQTKPVPVRQKWAELITLKNSNKEARALTPEEFFAETDYAQSFHYLDSNFRKNKLQEIASWYADNLKPLTEFVRSLNFKNYVKLFFTPEIPTLDDSYTNQQIYQFEYTLYTIPKIFNSNDYNQMANGEMTGLPGFNVSMNSKKPYLEHKTMRVVAPIRVSLDEAMLLKSTTEWLLSQDKFVTHKFKYETSFSLAKASGPEGAYHVYVEGKDNEVLSYENIPFSTEVLIQIPVFNYLEVRDHEGFVKDYSNMHINGAEQLQKQISSRFFRGRMNQDQGRFVYGDEPKPRDKDFTSVMGALFMQSRQAFHDWIYKGTEMTIRPIFDRTTLRLIEEQLLYVEPGGLKNGRLNLLDLRWLADAFNVRLSMDRYLKRNEGGPTMGDRISAVKASLKDKLALNDINVCGNDDEFYFLAGQIAYFLKSLSETYNKTGDLLGPFLSVKRSDQLKRRLEDAYALHKHKIRLNHFKFNRAFSSVFGYKPEAEPEGDVREFFIAGLLADNWFYEKSEKASNQANEGEDSND